MMHKLKKHWNRLNKYDIHFESYHEIIFLLKETDKMNETDRNYGLKPSQQQKVVSSKVLQWFKNTDIVKWRSNKNMI